jgi:hypothetical protein
MSRLARFFKAIQSAAVALTRDHAAALDELRAINRALLVTAFAEVPGTVAQLCDQARGNIISAIRELAPLNAGEKPPIEEQDPAEHRAQVEKGTVTFSPITDPPGLS